MTCKCGHSNNDHRYSNLKITEDDKGLLVKECRFCYCQRFNPYD